MSEKTFYQLLKTHFNKSELRELCFELGIDYEDLLGQRKRDLVRELILYCQRRGQLPRLLQVCGQKRPNVDWPDEVKAIELGIPPVPWWQRPILVVPIIVVFLLAAITIILVNVGGPNVITDMFIPETPLSFAPERESEVLIVIASFARTEGVADAEAHNEIRRAIEKEAAELEFTNLRVEVEPTVLRAEERDAAAVLGKRYDASMVIWGAETSVRVTVNYLNLKEPEFDASETELSVARPDAYVEFITEDVPGQMIFLSLFAVGQSYYVAEEYKNATLVIESAVAALTTNVEPPGGTAAAYFRLGWLYQVPFENVEQAVIAYDQAITLNPEYAKAYNNRGIARKAQGDLAGAIADYNQAIALNPEYAKAYNNRGIARKAQGNLAGAIADYNQANALNPEYAKA